MIYTSAENLIIIKENYFRKGKMYPQWHPFSFMVLEKKPESSDHPQGDRVLDCLSFSTRGMKIKGQARFDKFEIVLSIPQDGSLVPAQVQVINRQKDFFEVRFINPSKELLTKLSWWDKEVEEKQFTPHSKSVCELQNKPQ